MKKQFWLSSLFVLVFAFSANAASNEMVSRGGLGFLYPDHNSFNNAGQFALDKGTAIDVSFERTSVSGVTGQSITPSIVYGNGGTFGFGLRVNRAGTSLTGDDTTDTIGVGLGFALAKERLTLGITGDRSLAASPTSDGTVGAQINWNGMKRMGFSMGAGVGTTLNSVTGTDTRTGKVALGWGFNQMTKFEAVGTFNDLSNFSDYSLGGFLTVQGHMFYLGAGFNYNMLTKVSEADGRLGVTVGKLDFSALVNYPLESGSSPTFGGQARVTF